jgi:hypothetical protein
MSVETTPPLSPPHTTTPVVPENGDRSPRKPTEWEIWFETVLLPEYPEHRQVQTATAKREVRRLFGDEPTRRKLLEGLRAWKESPEWIREDGAYVPGIGKFIRDRWYERAPSRRPNGSAGKPRFVG